MGGSINPHSGTNLATCRALIEVDVLSEGVDLPAADTCLFVAPRRGIRLQQCVGRVLRKHPNKVDASSACLGGLCFRGSYYVFYEVV